MLFQFEDETDSLYVDKLLFLLDIPLEHLKLHLET